MKYVYALILSMFLVGCGTMNGTQIVKVPVATKCEPTTEITEITDYPTKRLTKEMSLFEKFQLTLAELKLLQGQNKELTAALSECTK